MACSRCVFFFIVLAQEQGDVDRRGEDESEYARHGEEMCVMQCYVFSTPLLINVFRVLIHRGGDE